MVVQAFPERALVRGSACGCFAGRVGRWEPMVCHELAVRVRTTDDQALSVVLLEITRAAFRGTPVRLEVAGEVVEILHAGFVATEVDD